jgi:hypothetical protein
MDAQQMAVMKLYLLYYRLWVEAKLPNIYKNSHFMLLSEI